MRWGLVVAGVGAASVLALATVANPAVASLAHPPDHDALHRSVQGLLYGEADRGPATPGQQWAATHLDVVDREADRACAWIKARPAPRHRYEPGGDFTYPHVLAAYLATPQAEPLGPDPYEREDIVSAAWEHICRIQRLAHTSPVRPPPD